MGAPSLASVECRLQALHLVLAQRLSDIKRAQRLDHYLWEKVILTFSSKVLALRLVCPPQRTRSHCDKLLQKRHWSLSYNSSKETRKVATRKALLTCILYQSLDSRDADRSRLPPPLSLSTSLYILPCTSVAFRLQRGSHKLPSFCFRRICKTGKLEALSSVLLRSDFSRVLVSAINSLWEAF